MDLLASVIVIVAEITDAAAAAATVNGEDEEGEEIDGKLTDFLSPLYSKKYRSIEVVNRNLGCQVLKKNIPEASGSFEKQLKTGGPLKTGFINH